MRYNTARDRLFVNWLLSELRELMSRFLIGALAIALSFAIVTSLNQFLSWSLSEGSQGGFIGAFAAVLFWVVVELVDAPQRLAPMSR